MPTCPFCGNTWTNSDYNSKSREILDTRGEKFKELFSKLLHRYEEGKVEHIFRFLDRTKKLPEGFLYSAINTHAHKADNVKRGKLLYLLAIIEREAEW